ncbi:MAG TPA: hypothetical protein DCW29_19930 [Janthinobacterium sp.]|nr:hypothetical protein [Janthinobacterium sp.]
MRRRYNKFSKFRRRLFAPLVYAAALFLLLEEFLWRTGARVMQTLARLPPLHALEDRIRRLPPYPALVAFVLPALLLFPVKVLALMAIAEGHACAGVAVIVLAKLGGAAAVARLYTLTRPNLLSLDWFARWNGKFLVLKNRWTGRLRATRAWRRLNAWRDGATRNKPARRRARSRGARVLRRFTALWRARRTRP